MPRNAHAVTAFSRDELLAFLSAQTDSRFAEPLATLVEMLRDEAKISCSTRLIPSEELSSIYVPRREHCEMRGILIPGLAAVVDVLTSTPSTGWQLISVSEPERSGGVFIAESRKTFACLAARSVKPPSNRP